MVIIVIIFYFFMRQEKNLIENKNNEEQKVKYIVEMGAEIAGGAVGTALGLLTANPVLAVTLGAVGAGISKTLIDTAEKYLSNREKMRAGAAAGQAITDIYDRIQTGQKLRNDNFFDNTGQSRASSEELFEGVLLSAKNEHEEKKITYISNIFSNSIFNTISIGEANHVLRIASNLTYRQMCILSLINTSSSLVNTNLSNKWLRDNEELISLLSIESISLRQEIMDMYSQGLIACEVIEENEDWGSARITKEDNNLAMMGWYDVVPAGLKLTELGDLCYSSMSLKNIPTKDLSEVAKLLEI